MSNLVKVLIRRRRDVVLSTWNDLDTGGGCIRGAANRCVAMATATSAEKPALYCPFLSRLDIISYNAEEKKGKTSTENTRKPTLSDRK
ncbi:unnamed protein product, partial [Brenthis ino]